MALGVLREASTRPIREPFHTKLRMADLGVQGKKSAWFPLTNEVFVLAGDAAAWIAVSAAREIKTYYPANFSQELPTRWVQVVWTLIGANVASIARKPSV